MRPANAVLSTNEGRERMAKEPRTIKLPDGRKLHVSVSGEKTPKTPEKEKANGK